MWIAPPRVNSIEEYWGEDAPVMSARCAYWMQRIAGGWRPSKRIRSLGYYGSADYFGVYISEWLNVLSPMISGHAPPVRTEVPPGANVIRTISAPVIDAIDRSSRDAAKLYLLGLDNMLPLRRPLVGRRDGEREFKRMIRDVRASSSPRPSWRASFAHNLWLSLTEAA